MEIVAEMNNYDATKKIYINILASYSNFLFTLQKISDDLAERN